MQSRESKAGVHGPSHPKTGVQLPYHLQGIVAESG